MQFSIRRVRSLVIKEFYQIKRDPSSILISIILPCILLFIYGFGVSLDLDHLRIGLVLEDTSPEAQGFARSLIDSPYFDVQISRNRYAFDREITVGQVRGIVVIPSYFSAFRHGKGVIAPIQVIADGSEPNTANFVQNYVKGAYQTWLAIERVSSDLKGLPLITFEPRYWYNEQLESRNFLIPGSLAIIMALVGTLLTALVVAREWERGTMEALLSTPVTILEIIIGKLIPYFILGMLTMLMCFLVAVYFYDVPFRGSLFALALVSASFLFTALGLGLLISTVSKNQFVAGQISMFTAFLPAFMLSGFIFEISSMPQVIQYITYVLPPRYLVSALQTLFLVGNVWTLLLVDIAITLVIGIVLFLMTARISHKRLE